MSELDKLKKKIRDEVDEIWDFDEDSDLPVTEKKTKQKKIRT
ncbi:MAG: hypothetical protein ABIC91_02070 [Nanoarchaeota archaeon]